MAERVPRHVRRVAVHDFFHDLDHVLHANVTYWPVAPSGYQLPTNGALCILSLPLIFEASLYVVFGDSLERVLSLAQLLAALLLGALSLDGFWIPALRN